jgi:hypothetical protein
MDSDKRSYNQLEESAVSKFVNWVRYPSNVYSIVTRDLFCPFYEHHIAVCQGFFSNETKKMAHKLDDMSIPFFKGAAYATPIYLGLYELPIGLKFLAGATAGALNVLVNEAAFWVGQHKYSDINFPEKSKKAFMEFINLGSKKLRVSKKSLESQL